MITRLIWLEACPFNRPDRSPEPRPPSRTVPGIRRSCTPCHETHQGIPVTWSQRHNYMKIVKMVGPPGLEPVDVGSDGLLEQLDRAVLNQGCHSD